MINLTIGGKTVQFNRIVGGFAWPSERPGFCIIVGEHVTRYAAGDIYRYMVLSEVEEQQMDKLIQDSIRIRMLYKAQGMYGRLKRRSEKQLPAMHFLDLWNGDAGRTGKIPFYLYEAPYTEERGLIQYHFNILRAMLNPEEKILYLGERSNLSSYMMEVQEDPNQMTDTNYPAVAALGYAVAQLENSRGGQMQERELEMMMDQMYGERGL